MISSDMFTVDGNARVTNLAMISAHASQVLHADFFPRLVKYYVAAGECMKEQQSYGHLMT